MGYGDHSDLHDHGPAGYWDGREAEQREYEEGYRIRQAAHDAKRRARKAYPQIDLRRVVVRERPDGRYEADCPERPGSPPVGRGATWLEALGDYLIQNVEEYRTEAVVLGRDGRPVPPEFFGPQHRRD